LLSTTAFMGTDDEGRPSEAIWADDGRHHVIGSLPVAAPSPTKKICLIASRLAGALRGIEIVLISLENFEDPDFG
jgi:hypothetical protein